MKISQAIYAGSSTRVSRKPGRKLPEFAFIGRSNVGKSSLINMLCGKSRLALTSATPGKTKVVNHFLVNDKWYLVDLPGYGYAKMSNKGREELTAVISDYILNSQEMVMLFVLVDSRYEITARDLDFISNLGQNRIPFGIVPLPLIVSVPPLMAHWMLSVRMPLSPSALSSQNATRWAPTPSRP